MCSEFLNHSRFNGQQYLCVCVGLVLYYVTKLWLHVTLEIHINSGQVLNFSAIELGFSVHICKSAKI
jgi:hypothetical protein